MSKIEMGACGFEEMALNGKFLEWESGPSLYFSRRPAISQYAVISQPCCYPRTCVIHTKTKQMLQYQQSQFPNSIIWISQPCRAPSIDHLSNELVIPPSQDITLLPVPFRSDSPAPCEILSHSYFVALGNREAFPHMRQ